MTSKTFYILQIEDLTNGQYEQVLNFFDSIGLKKYLYHDLDDMIQVEYIDKETFEKISNFLKTL